MSDKRIDRSFSCDEDIEERLRKLKEDKSESSLTDQKAIEERLARLKGIDPNIYTMPPITVYQQTKQKTDVEKADDLLKQLSEELNIDDSTRVSFSSTRRSSTDEEIERRLARLRGQQHVDHKTNISGLMDIDSDDEETQQNKLIDRLLAESNLPSIPSDVNSLDAKEEEDVEIVSDSLPWCQICNEDAVVKCIDCMGDLYCKQCFLDFHDDSDLKRHKTEPFRQPKRGTEF